MFLGLLSQLKRKGKRMMKRGWGEPLQTICVILKEGSVVPWCSSFKYLFVNLSLERKHILILLSNYFIFDILDKKKLDHCKFNIHLFLFMRENIMLYHIWWSGCSIVQCITYTSPQPLNYWHNLFAKLTDEQTSQTLLFREAIPDEQTNIAFCESEISPDMSKMYLIEIIIIRLNI